VQDKKKKKDIKVRDLKPKKDAKGGVSSDVSINMGVSGHSQSHSIQGRQIQRPGRGGS
jgi:hypothetical protein